MEEKVKEGIDRETVNEREKREIGKKEEGRGI